MIKRQFFHMITHLLIIATSHKGFMQSALGELFGTWLQAHAYEPSDYMETRL